MIVIIAQPKLIPLKYTQYKTIHKSQVPLTANEVLLIFQNIMEFFYIEDQQI